MPGDRDRNDQGRAEQARPRDALGRPLAYGAAGVPPISEDPLPPAETLAYARSLLDGGRPFAAHEALEVRWKSCPPQERELWQGLAQVCVALTHGERGNAVGAQRLLERAAGHLTAYADTGGTAYGLDLGGVVTCARGRLHEQGQRVPDVELVADPGRDDAFTLRVGGTDQSHVDLADPLRLDFDYVRRCADVIDEVHPAPQRVAVLHVGGAGLTLPRWVAATRPTSRQVVLEPDAELTALVRERLPLPPRSGIKVRDQDGRSGLPLVPPEWADVVVLDAYAGARVPADLTTLEALGEMARVLRPGGVWLANLGDRAPFDHVRRVVAAARPVLPELLVLIEPVVLKGRRFGNLLLVGSTRPLPVASLVRGASGSAFPYRVLAGSDVADRFGGGEPFTDVDSEPSPEPPPDTFGRR